MYKPLPESLTIKQSKVNGLGLFAKEGIAQGTNLGMTHTKIGEKFIRTPLGGFINHSEKPNCTKLEENGVLHLVTLGSIKPGDELLVRYTLYDFTAPLEPGIQSQ